MIKRKIINPAAKSLLNVLNILVNIHIASTAPIKTSTYHNSIVIGKPNKYGGKRKAYLLSIDGLVLVHLYYRGIYLKKKINLAESWC